MAFSKVFVDSQHLCSLQAAQINETVSTCRFAQRMMHVAVAAQRNFGGLSSVHGNFMKLDPLMQQYLEVRLPLIWCPHSLTITKHTST